MKFLFLYSSKLNIFAGHLQGRSSAGLERFSHIEEVIGSNPIVPTINGEGCNSSLLFFLPLCQLLGSGTIFVQFIASCGIMAAGGLTENKKNK